MSQKPPTRAMREDPDLDQLKRQAKELLNAYRAQQPEAAAEVNFYHRTATPDTFALHDAQFALARSAGMYRHPGSRRKIEISLQPGPIDHSAMGVARECVSEIVNRHFRGRHSCGTHSHRVLRIRRGLLELWSIFCKDQTVDGSFSLLAVKRQLKTILQKRLKHRAQVARIGIVCGLRENIESFRVDPARPARNLKLLDAVCAHDQGPQPSIRDIESSMLKAESAASSGRIVPFDRGNFEDGTRRSILSAGSARERRV
jgi:hypothetical protein